MTSVKITYETLYDLLRREKSRDELQVLDESFYDDVAAYISAKIADGAALPHADQDKARLEVQNIHKLVKELFDRRQKKFVSIALTKSRGGVVVDEEAMLKEEKYCFEEVSRVLSKFSESVLAPLLATKQGVPPLKPLVKSTPEAPSTPSEPENTPKAVSMSEEEKSPENEEKADEAPAEPAEERVTIHFLHPIPKFLGRDLETFGPYKPGDEAALPSQIATILLSKGRAKKV